MKTIIKILFLLVLLALLLLGFVYGLLHGSSASEGVWGCTAVALFFAFLSVNAGQGLDSNPHPTAKRHKSLLYRVALILAGLALVGHSLLGWAAMIENHR
ncbi:MAG: hypothetical protein V4819_23305 [Verrucomicrobiota bacterium]